jgi:N-acyl-D-amino-acid deacylase
MAGKDNWNKFDRVIGMIDHAQRAGIRITADMYTYVAAAFGLNASMPPWVQSGGLETWISNYTRARDSFSRDC